MKKVIFMLFLAVLAASISMADVLFTENNKMSLGFLADTSGFRNGVLIGGGFGLNNRLELDMSYTNVNEGGVTVQIVVPGIKYYLLKPDENNIWFWSLKGDYLIINASSGSSALSASGYFIGTDLGLDLKALPGYKIMPYVGVVQVNYSIGSTTVNKTAPRVGAYLGIPLGGGTVVYVKQLLTFMDNQSNYSAAIGYHLPIN
ncbi:MAG: hypothetical protein KJ732_03770 [Candidatus Margulisbacteria bacterium]|nr:hypothetical protein [Candidatus Margulisiibacteriota bacterium]